MELITLLTHKASEFGTRLDLSVSNPALAVIPSGDTAGLSQWINQRIQSEGKEFGYGGYLENRGIYPAGQFGNEGEARSLHLGLDIWMYAGSPVYLPKDGKLHSFQDNNHPGDYGPTLIFEHQDKTGIFYTLYGHLSRTSLVEKSVGMLISAGTQIATLGEPFENRDWPPHLHFQVILDLLGNTGDFPGVCKLSEADYWAGICPCPERVFKVNG